MINNPDIRSYCCARVSAGIIKRDNSDPETILKIAAHLRIDPAGCLVIKFDQFTNVKILIADYSSPAIKQLL
ncbi:MAG: hypothetical protein J0L56_01685 [Chitinophagales bacterium]|nr:hypothetical protein [Chitinophagales bacterium]